MQCNPEGKLGSRSRAADRIGECGRLLSPRGRGACSHQIWLQRTDVQLQGNEHFRFFLTLPSNCIFRNHDMSRSAIDQSLLHLHQVGHSLSVRAWLGGPGTIHSMQGLHLEFSGLATSYLFVTVPVKGPRQVKPGEPCRARCSGALRPRQPADCQCREPPLHSCQNWGQTNWLFSVRQLAFGRRKFGATLGWNYWCLAWVCKQ